MTETFTGIFVFLTFFNKSDAPRAYLPADLQESTKKVVVVRCTAAVVLKQGRGGRFWARVSQYKNKGDVGSSLEVAVYGGVRR